MRSWNPTAPSGPAMARGGKPGTWVLAATAAVVGLLGFAVLATSSLIHERQLSERQVRIDAENLSRVLQEQALNTAEKIDLVLQGLQGQIAPDDLRSGDAARRLRVQRLLGTRLAGIPQVSGLHIADAAGHVIYSSHDALPAASVADRDDFRRQRAVGDAGLAVSEPLVAPAAGNWSLAFSRRLESADGRFAGVIIAVLDLDYFHRFYRSLDLGPHGTVVLRDRRMRLLARYPPSPTDMGRAIPGHHGSQFIEQGLDHAVYHARGQVDGTARLYSMRQVGTLPLYVFAGIAEEDYLAPWRDRRASYIVVAALMSLVVAGLLWLTRRSLAAQEDSLQALTRSQARYQDAQTAAHIGCWELDLHSQALTWSDEIYRIFEIDPARFGASYQAFLDLIHPDDRDAVNRAYTESVANRTPYSIDHRLRFGDGRVKHVREHCVTFYDEQGAPLRSVGTVQDISERALAEEAVRVSEERFRTMADYTYDWEYWQGPAHEMLYVTPSCERVTGYSRDEFMAQPQLVHAIVHPDDQLLVKSHVDDIRHEDLATIDFRIVRRDGAVRWIAHGCRAVYWSDGRFMGRRASNRDITERKQLEQALQDLNRTLEARIEEEVAKNRAKDHIVIQQSRLAAMGEMVHNIAHQWRQPLNALAIIVSNIKDDFDYGELSGERLDQAIGRVRHLLDQMSNTIDDFRDFFQPDREPTEFDVAAAVDEALFIMEASLHNNRIELEKRMQPGLLAFGHANQFSQAVLNLVANAKDALQLSKVTPARIAVAVDRDGDQALLTVRDNAGGIPADIVPRVFEPYFTTKEQGSGIGLYMTKMIIERNLHGTISAGNDSSGALITVRVPLLSDGPQP